MTTFIFARGLVAGAALFTAAEACVQAHNYMYNNLIDNDIMSSEVYVDGHVVCFGNEGYPFASGDTEFCLRNHDGKGSGCAPGYVYCTRNNGKSAYIEYYGKYPPGGMRYGCPQPICIGGSHLANIAISRRY